MKKKIHKNITKGNIIKEDETNYSCLIRYTVLE